MPKTVTNNKGQTKKDKNDQKKTPPNAAIARARQVMKLHHSGDDKLYNAELAKLLDEFGVDFVCQHACQEAAHGRKACPEGHCAKPYEHTGADDCTCGEMMFYYIDSFVGYRTDEEAKAASASVYGQIPSKTPD
jgi:hypothetical protein